MAENTKIEWAHHTFNPWVGCTKVSPACDHCYAEAWAKRTGNGHLWNDGERRRTSEATWRLPLKWNREAEERGIRYRVFCASLADVFDNVVPDEWRGDLLRLIRQTPHLDWLLLTKRIGNARHMLERTLSAGHLWHWPNVWLGITVVNQDEADRDVPKLLSTPARVRFLSLEPLLGPVDLTSIWLRMPGARGQPQRRVLAAGVPPSKPVTWGYVPGVPPGDGVGVLPGGSRLWWCANWCGHQRREVLGRGLGGRLPRDELHLRCASRALLGSSGSPPRLSGVAWSSVHAIAWFGSAVLSAMSMGLPQIQHTFAPSVRSRCLRRCSGRPLRPRR